MTTPATVPQSRADRIEAVCLMFLRGATEEQVRILVAEWNVSEEETAILILSAQARFRKWAEIDSTMEKGKALGQLLDLYGRCLRNTDYARALATRKELNAVLGLTGEVKRKVRPAAEDPIAAEIAQLEEDLEIS